MEQWEKEQRRRQLAAQKRRETRAKQRDMAPVVLEAVRERGHEDFNLEETIRCLQEQFPRYRLSLPAPPLREEESKLNDLRADQGYGGFDWPRLSHAIYMGRAMSGKTT
jgi:hypothetical protein